MNETFGVGFRILRNYTVVGVSNKKPSFCNEIKKYDQIYW